MSYREVVAEIAAGGIVIIDGATGTELQRRGAEMHKGSWCALATEAHPAMLRSIHEDYIRAGARIVTANTFATTREVLEPLGHGDKFESLNRRAVELAVEARDNLAGGPPVLVAGSISHVRPTHGGAWSPEASDIRKFEDDCTEMAAIHKAAGCDMILAEMMGDADFTPCIIRAAKANSLPVWVGLSALQRSDGIIGTYTSAAVPFADVLASIVAEEGAEVMGIMHSKPELVLPALELLKGHWSGPLLAYPDSLSYNTNEGVNKLSLEHVIDDDAFVGYCERWIDAGVQVLGGCCGLTVSHIAALSHRLGRERVGAT